MIIFGIFFFFQLSIESKGWYSILIRNSDYNRNEDKGDKQHIILIITLQCMYINWKLKLSLCNVLMKKELGLFYIFWIINREDLVTI